jgi:hypothetical protein
MTDYEEIVTARIVDGAGAPVKGARVEVWDKDMLIDDYLGTAVTGADGRFRVDFRWSDYKDSPFDGRPDIFLKVLHPTGGKSTKSKVFYELKGVLSEDDSQELMDLGDIPID